MMKNRKTRQSCTARSDQDIKIRQIVDKLMDILNKKVSHKACSKNTDAYDIKSAD
jgi:hypothetical protein